MADGEGARHALRQYPGAIGGRSRRATPLTRRPAFRPPPRPQKVTCPHLLGQFEKLSAVNRGGTGWISGGTKAVTIVFNRFPSPRNSYEVCWFNWPDLTLDTHYSAQDFYDTPFEEDFVEFDDDGLAYLWYADTGDLERWVISGSAYVFDTTLLSGEAGEHMSVFNYYDGLLYYALVGSTDPMCSVDPSTGSRVDVTSGGVSWDFHERMCVAPNGDVWAHAGSSGGDHSFVVYRPGTGEIDTLLSVDSARDVFWGMYPAASGMAVMVAPDDAGAVEWNVYQVNAGSTGAGSLLPCRFTTSNSVTGTTFGVTHDGAAVTRGGDYFIRAGRTFAPFDRFVDRGVWAP